MVGSALGSPKNGRKMGRRLGEPQHNGTCITRLPVGELPLTMRRQLIGARKYRKELETLVADAKGGVNSTDAHLINEAVSAEIHAAVCRWLLRTRLEKMTVSDVAKCSGEILKAKTTRNRAVQQLRIDVPPEPMDVKTYIEGKYEAKEDGGVES